MDFSPLQYDGPELSELRARRVIHIGQGMDIFVLPEYQVDPRDARFIDWPENDGPLPVLPKRKRFGLWDNQKQKCILYTTEYNLIPRRDMIYFLLWKIRNSDYELKLCDDITNRNWRKIR